MQLTAILRSASCKNGYPAQNILRVMKLTPILLFAPPMQISAKGVGQNISLSEKNAPVQRLFAEIERQTSYNFVYTDDLLQQAKTVDIDIKNGSLEEVLALIFNDQPLIYSVVEKVIVVKARPAPIVQ